MTMIELTTLALELTNRDLRDDIVTYHGNSVIDIYMNLCQYVEEVQTLQGNEIYLGYDPQEDTFCSVWKIFIIDDSDDESEEENLDFGTVTYGSFYFTVDQFGHFNDEMEFHLVDNFPHVLETWQEHTSIITISGSAEESGYNDNEGESGYYEE